MATPNAVKRRAEKARELAQKAAQGNAQPQAQPVQQIQRMPPTAPVEQAPVEQHPPVQQTQPQVQQVQSQPIHEPAQPVMQVAPVQQQAPVQQPQQAPVSALGNTDSAEENWEMRYKNLRNAGDERSKKLMAQVEQLERQVLDLTSKLEQTSGQPSSNNPYSLTEDERKEMSADAIVAFEKMAERQMRQDQTKQTETQVDREALFFADVDSQVPGWQTINADPNFVAWLKQPDGYSGRTRHATLQQARSSLDSETVVALFSAYANGETGPDSNHGNVQQHVQHVEVQPGRSTFDPNATQGAPAETFTQAQIKDFYAQKNELTRRRKMTPQLAEQFAARDLQIREAIRDGRVR